MATLDDNYIDPADVSFWPTAIRYGGIAGVILIAFGLLMHLTGMTDYSGQGGATTWIQNIVTYGVWIGGIVMAVKYHRDQELGGFVSFGRAFGLGLVTALIMGIIGALWTYIFFSFIAPEAIDMIMEAAMENMPEGQAEATEGMMSAMMSPGAMTIWMIVGSLVGGGIISLIVAAIMKREQPYA